MKRAFDIIVQMPGNSQVATDLITFFTSRVEISSSIPATEEELSTCSSKASSTKQRRCKSGSESMLSSHVRKNLKQAPDLHLKVFDDPEISKFTSRGAPSVLTKAALDSRDESSKNIVRAGASEPTSKMFDLNGTRGGNSTTTGSNGGTALSSRQSQITPLDGGVYNEDGVEYPASFDPTPVQLTEDERQLQSIFLLSIPNNAQPRRVPSLNMDAIIRPKTMKTSTPKLTEKEILKCSSAQQPTSTLVLSPRTAFDVQLIFKILIK